MIKIKRFITQNFSTIVICTIILMIIGYFIKVIGFDRKEVVLSVLILDETENLDIDMLKTEWKESLNITSEKEDIMIMIHNTEIAQSEDILLTKLRARTIDILIAEEELFEKYEESDFFRKENLPGINLKENTLYNVAGTELKNPMAGIIINTERASISEKLLDILRE